MKKNDEGKKIFGLILIFAVIVSVFGGVVSAEDISEDLTKSFADTWLFDKNNNFDSAGENSYSNISKVNIPLPLTTRVEGIDVSHHQGNIDWSSVYNSGKNFAFAKATEGVGFTDPNFDKNMDEAHAAGMLIGAYHYARPDLGNDAADEARYFVSVAGMYLKDGYLRPALDLEEGADLGKAALSNWVHEWMNTVKSETGIEPIIYVNSNYANNYLDSSVAKYNLWIAHWRCDTGTPPNTGIWADWDFCQYYSLNYCGQNSVPGISGGVDLDIFNGDISSLYTFVITAEFSFGGETARFGQMADKPVMYGSRTPTDNTTIILGQIQGVIEEKGAKWTAGKTSVSGLSMEEKKQLCGVKTGALPIEDVVLNPPKVSYGTFDWRNVNGQNWVTSVKSQGLCGSCWIFGSTAALETQINIDAEDPTIDFDASEQHILSCLGHGWGCDGGWPGDCLVYIRDSGVPDEACFPYQADDTVPCNDACSDWPDRVYTCDIGLPEEHTTEIYKAILQHCGPMVVVLNITEDFFYYTGGIYEPVWTSLEFGWADHCVMLIGYDDPNGCWIVKNSWGPDWGDEGYGKVYYGNLEKYETAWFVLNTSGPCGDMGVNPTSWSTTIDCGESDNEIVTVSASDNIVNGVTVSKVSGPTWLSVSPTNLGDISSGSSKTFTITASPPSETSGDFPYSVKVSNTCGTPSTRDVSGTIHVKPPSETVVSIEDASAPQGATVTVPINIAGVENMCGANIWLNYNKNVVIVDSVSDGDLVPLTHNIDNTAGVTKMNWDTTSGMTGDFVFAYVTLKAVGNPGDTCLLDLDVKELYDCVPPFNEIPRTVADGTFTIPSECGNMGVNPTSWSTTLNCGESDSQIVTVSASGGIVEGVTVSKISGPTWLSVSPTNLGDISSGSSKTFTITVSPPSETSGDFTYTVRVSNTCGTPSTRDVTGTIHVPCPESSWTFMIYLDGDNNLESAAIADFLEMSSVGSTSNESIVVQFDRIDGCSSEYGDWTTCKRFLVTQGMTPTAANALMDLGECNMGDPNTLRDFVEWTMTEFLADNYALILWNHGDGWKSINKWVPWADDIKDAKNAGLTRGICWDFTNSDYLSLQETEQALTGKYVQLLGYDACLMHMIEVVYQVMANAGISVGSEDSEPGDGWPYDTILSDLAETSSMYPSILGETIVSRYIESYAPATYETQSAVDQTDVPNLATAVDNFAQALINELPAHKQDILQARTEVDSVGDYIDLYHFAELVESYIPSAASAAQAVMDNLGNTVYAEAHGSSHANFYGLSIYFPKAERAYLSSYENTKFAVDTHWDEFLKEYYAPSICGNMNVNPTSWSTTILCGNTDSKTITVSASGGTVKGVTVSKVSGPTWLSVSPTDLGDISSGSSKTFTMTAAPPSGTSSGDYTYTIRVSNTCGTLSSRDVTGTITVYCPELSYSPASHDFGDKCEGETDSTTFELWNSRTGTLTYSLSETCGWVEVNPTSGSSTGEHDGITVDIDTAGLSEGSYICNISISSNGGNGTFTVTVNIIPLTGSIYVTSEPSGAKIYLDNKYEGKTPHTITEVPPGYHTIKLTLMGYYNWTKRIQVTAGETTYVHATLTPLPICPDLVITGKWLCWPDNCTICYNVTNIGNGTAPACHNTTLYVDGVAVAHDYVPVDLAPGESYIGCFGDYTWTYSPPSGNITVCADNNEALDELDENNNCLTNIWMCGDVRKDGFVTAWDVAVLNSYVAGIGELEVERKWAGDVRTDGYITAWDVAVLNSKVAGIGAISCMCTQPDL